MIVTVFLMGLVIGFFIACMGMIAMQMRGDPALEEQIERMREARREIHRTRLFLRLKKFQLLANRIDLAMKTSHRINRNIRSFSAVVEEEIKHMERTKRLPQ